MKYRFYLALTKRTQILTKNSYFRRPKSFPPFVMLVNREIIPKGAGNMEAVYSSAIPKKESIMTFEDMYIQNRKLMMHTAMKILNNFADAEDCVSEAFFRVSKIFSKISQLERPKLTSLLVIIVRNAALDKYRANKRIVAVEEPDTETGTVYNDSYSFDSVIASIGQLKDEYRDVLMLKFVYGYSIKEMTDILGISADNAYKRIQRAKSELARIIEKEG